MTETSRPAAPVREVPVTQDGSILSGIGNTPLLRIRLFEDECPDVAVFGKAEFLNAGGSVKDRPALRMIRDGEASGALTHQRTILDSTSGNTGIIENTRFARADRAADRLESWPARLENKLPGGLVAIIKPDSNLLDGRWANNAWLQELPRPFTNLVWDNAALIAPAFARKHQLENGDQVVLRSDHGTIEAPVWILSGQADDCVTLHLGYGRRAAGQVGNGHGFDAYPLRSDAQQWIVPLRDFRKAGRTTALVSTQGHFAMEGRDLVRTLQAGMLAEAARESNRFSSLVTRHLFRVGVDRDFDPTIWTLPVNLGVEFGLAGIRCY